eukprot:TRINITY_DN399_c1_g3_i1.p1 TRINITY_DN399_c1_g3~~TRINITY_DN399_c1_g3_i1.p1  ORF type:complete len:359 (+),score=68.39 TRINITY_DN399_c1_g3_i1:230-1306(+)
MLFPMIGLMLGRYFMPGVTVVGLPLVLGTGLADLDGFLKISFCFYLVGVLGGIMDYGLGSKMYLGTALQMPMILIVLSGGYHYIPSALCHLYLFVLTYAVPMVCLLEAVQVVRLVVHFSRRFCLDIDDRPPVVKVVVVVVSLVAYAISVVMAITLYLSPSLDVTHASFLSVVCTLLIILLVLTPLVADVIITESAFISLFCMFVVDRAFVTSDDAWNLTSSLTRWIAMAPAWLAASVGGRITPDPSVAMMLTPSAIVEIFLAILCIVTLRWKLVANPLDWDPERDDEDEDEEEESDTTTSLPLVRILIRHTVMTAGYTYFILYLVGTIPPPSIVWRVLSTIVCLVFYASNVYQLASSE